MNWLTYNRFGLSKLSFLLLFLQGTFHKAYEAESSFLFGTFSLTEKPSQLLLRPLFQLPTLEKNQTQLFHYFILTLLPNLWKHIFSFPSLTILLMCHFLHPTSCWASGWRTQRSPSASWPLMSRRQWRRPAKAPSQSLSVRLSVLLPSHRLASARSGASLTFVWLSEALSLSATSPAPYLLGPPLQMSQLQLR